LELVEDLTRPPEVEDELRSAPEACGWLKVVVVADRTAPCQLHTARIRNRILST
jgi:hypothetical protein